MVSSSVHKDLWSHIFNTHTLYNNNPLFIYKVASISSVCNKIYKHHFVAKESIKKWHNTLIHQRLSKAAKQGNYRLCKIFIIKGAKNYNMALWYATRCGHRDLIELLITKYGANDYNWALAGAARGGHKELVDLFINKYGAYNYNRGLAGAAGGGHRELVEFFINEYGATDFNWALRRAAFSGHLELVELLIRRYGVNDYKEALGYANENGHTHIVDFLQKKTHEEKNK